MQTFAEKYADETCMECKGRLVRPGEVNVWRCKGGLCGKKCHISCMYEKLYKQIKVNGSSVSDVGCTDVRCAAVMSREDRDEVMFQMVDKLRDEKMELVEKVDTLSAMVLRVIQKNEVLEANVRTLEHTVRNLQADNALLKQDNALLKQDNVRLQHRVLALERENEVGKEMIKQLVASK